MPTDKKRKNRKSKVETGMPELVHSPEAEVATTR